MKTSPTLLVVVDNLFIATQIAASAKMVGVMANVVRSTHAAASCRELRPKLVLVDLEAAPDIVAVIAELRSMIEPGVGHLIGFYPHVRTELREAALAAGLDQAWPRSALQTRLTGLLRSAAASAP